MRDKPVGHTAGFQRLLCQLQCRLIVRDRLAKYLREYIDKFTVIGRLAGEFVRLAGVRRRID
jgi:hypothetical protein